MDKRIIVRHWDNPVIQVATDLPRVQGRDQVRIMQPAHYELLSCATGRIYDIDLPVGYTIDGASVPRPFWWFSPPISDWIGGAAIHDLLYYLRICEKSIADSALYQIVRAKRSRAYAETIYQAVNLFGGSAWSDGDAMAARKELVGLGMKPFWYDPKWIAEEWSKV